jgi:hypothetical protein
MLTFKTALCKQRDHREIVFYLSEEGGIDPQWLLSFFEDAVLKGRRFEPGQTVQIGWMVTMLKLNGKGEIEVWEPQFDSFPVQWTPSVNNTIRHLILQKSVSELFGCEPDFPSLRQAGLISSGFFKASHNVIMSRDQPSGNDSGWFFRASGQDREGGELKSLYEISLHHIEIVPFLALPKGASVTRTEGSIQVEFTGKRVTSDENELLRRLATSPLLV